MIVMSTVSAALVIIYYKLRNRLKDFTLEYKIEEEGTNSLKLFINHHRQFCLEQTTGPSTNQPIKKEGELTVQDFKKLKHLIQQSNLLKMKKKSVSGTKEETPVMYSFFISSEDKENRIFLTGQPDKNHSKAFIKLNDHLRNLSGKLTDSCLGK